MGFNLSTGALHQYSRVESTPVMTNVNEAKIFLLGVLSNESVSGHSQVA